MFRFARPVPVPARPSLKGLTGFLFNHFNSKLQAMTIDGLFLAAYFVSLDCIKDYQNDIFECKTNNLGYNNMN